MASLSFCTCASHENRPIVCSPAVISVERSVASSSTLATMRIIALAVAGTIASAGRISWSVGKRLAGAIVSHGVVHKLVTKTFAGAMDLAGFLRLGGEQFAIMLTATIDMTGTLTKSVLLTFAGFITSIRGRFHFNRRGTVGARAGTAYHVGTDAYAMSVGTDAATIGTVGEDAYPAYSVGAEADTAASVGAEHE